LTIFSLNAVSEYQKALYKFLNSVISIGFPFLYTSVRIVLSISDLLFVVHFAGSSPTTLKNIFTQNKSSSSFQSMSSKK